MHKKVATPPEAVRRCRIVKVFRTISRINVAQDIKMVVIVFIHMRVSLFRRDKDNSIGHCDCLRMQNVCVCVWHILSLHFCSLHFIIMQI